MTAFADFFLNILLIKLDTLFLEQICPKHCRSSKKKKKIKFFFFFFFFFFFAPSHHFFTPFFLDSQNFLHIFRRELKGSKAL